MDELTGGEEAVQGSKVHVREKSTELGIKAALFGTIKKEVLSN